MSPSLPPSLNRYAVSALLVLSLLFTASAFGAGQEHPHHLGFSVAAASHDEEYAAGIGLEYSYRFTNKLGLLLFAEEVSGDFDVQTVGVGVVRFFDSGFKIGGGIGVERKIKNDKHLGLIHIGAGYDWHFGRISIGPMVAVDFIENNHDTYYLGVAMGYGF